MQPVVPETEVTTSADAVIDSARGVNMDEVAAFVVVADERSMVRAAARLHVDRSAPGKLLKRLERRWGVRLVVGTTRTLALTADGARVLPQARALLTVAARTVELARAHRTRAAPPLAGRAVMLDGTPEPANEIVLP